MHYIIFFIICRIGNTSTTSKTQNNIDTCPMCVKKFPSVDDLKNHILECGLNKAKELIHKCPSCNYATKRERDLKRHLETKHNTTNDVNIETDNGNRQLLLTTTPPSPKSNIEERSPPNKLRRVSSSATRCSKEEKEPSRKMEMSSTCNQRPQTTSRKHCHRIIERVEEFMKDGKKVKETETNSWDWEEM